MHALADGLGITVRLVAGCRPLLPVAPGRRAAALIAITPTWRSSQSATRSSASRRWSRSAAAPRRTRGGRRHVVAGDAGEADDALVALVEDPEGVTPLVQGVEIGDGGGPGRGRRCGSRAAAVTPRAAPSRRRGSGAGSCTPRTPGGGEVGAEVPLASPCCGPTSRWFTPRSIARASGSPATTGVVPQKAAPRRRGSPGSSGVRPASSLVSTTSVRQQGEMKGGRITATRGSPHTAWVVLAAGARQIRHVPAAGTAHGRPTAGRNAPS